MTGPGPHPIAGDRPVDRRTERRCAVLLRLAAEEGRRGHRREARDLLAVAECEARRSGRPDLLVAVRGAGAAAR
ncbi:MAG: hypothetical protein KDB10_11355 [Acidimicrobiales bacterium]|nr:hypothetical protein [Acidimicrobiales bacterium]MCB9372398.1 hypothetical protein [Microthrixaceae bacterium]